MVYSCMGARFKSLVREENPFLPLFSFLNLFDEKLHLAEDKHLGPICQHLLKTPKNGGGGDEYCPNCLQPQVCLKRHIKRCP